jgi:hypothetical protein
LRPELAGANLSSPHPTCRLGRGAKILDYYSNTIEGPIAVPIHACATQLVDHTDSSALKRIPGFQWRYKEACVDGLNKRVIERYVTQPEKVKADLCAYMAASGWSKLSQPETWAKIVTAKDCPPYKGSFYIPTHNVSADEFYSISRLRVERFARARAKLPTDVGEIERIISQCKGFCLVKNYDVHLYSKNDKFAGYSVAVTRFFFWYWSRKLSTFVY